MPNLKPIEKRAASLGRKINKAIDDGKFQLDVGYASKTHPIWNPAPKAGVVCTGCALAAAAYAIGRVPLSAGQHECIQVVTQKITHDDAAQLECGYERWTNTQITIERKGKTVHKTIKARTKNAFYKLGQKLREQRPAFKG